MGIDPGHGAQRGIFERTAEVYLRQRHRTKWPRNQLAKADCRNAGASPARILEKAARGITSRQTDYGAAKRYSDRSENEISFTIVAFTGIRLY